MPRLARLSRPCGRAFPAGRRLPAAVMGPREGAPFRGQEEIVASDDILRAPTFQDTTCGTTNCYQLLLFQLFRTWDEERGVFSGPQAEASG